MIVKYFGGGTKDVKTPEEICEEILEIFRNVDNEATYAPYWMIIDPRRATSRDPYAIASAITGPFFSREEAEQYLQNREYAFGRTAVVFCHGGEKSWRYKELWEAIWLDKNRPVERAKERMEFYIEQIRKLIQEYPSFFTREDVFKKIKEVLYL